MRWCYIAGEKDFLPDNSLHFKDLEACCTQVSSGDEQTRASKLVLDSPADDGFTEGPARIPDSMTEKRQYEPTAPLVWTRVLFRRKAGGTCLRAVALNPARLDAVS